MQRENRILLDFALAKKGIAFAVCLSSPERSSFGPIAKSAVSRLNRMFFLVISLF